MGIVRNLLSSVQSSHRVLQLLPSFLPKRPKSSNLTSSMLYFPSFYHFDVLCDPTDLLWKKGSPFKAMTDLTAPLSDGVLVEVFWGFPQL